MSFTVAIVALNPPQAAAGTPSPFTNMNRPISIAALPDRLVATRFCARRVLSISDTGTITTFANLPASGGLCLGRDLAVSPGLGGFPLNHVFVVQRQTIYSIQPTGGSATRFATIPSLPNSDSSLTFDRVGSFDHKLIVTDRRGPVWTVSSGGRATQIADVGVHIEGPEVAPLAFDPVGGKILVSNDFDDTIYAVGQNGSVTEAATYESPESVRFLPSNYCNYGGSGGAYFVTSEFSDQITKFPAADFNPLTPGMHALIQTKVGMVGLLTSTGGELVATDFHPTPIGDELEGATFFTCA
jgi:DNA-binding beta-propeller fold protein YncE